MKTYNDLYIALRQALRAAGVEACSLEARLLVAKAAGKTPEKLMQDLRLYASPAIENAVNAMGVRRLAGEPAAYILGTWDFYGLELTVTPDVLIPRGDTETLVDAALERVSDREASLRILDLCTGSGCIGCALGVHLPRTRVIFGDRSRKALEVAKQNARSCGLGARAICVETDALAAPAAQFGSFDMIVSNPPYVTPAEIETLDASVRDFEPRMALDGGEDGLDFYRSIAANWSPMLKPAGWLLLEVGETQAAAVEDILRAAGLSEIGSAKDTAGYDRVVFARR